MRNVIVIQIISIIGKFIRDQEKDWQYRVYNIDIDLYIHTDGI